MVLTGGGTGGHVFPMRAIAEALLDAGLSKDELRFVGSRRGQEATILGTGPIALTLLPGRGIRRSWTPRAVRDNVAALGALMAALARAIVSVGRWRPRVVVSVGGYAAAAVGAAAVLWRRPLVLVDLDATPSVTHRILARFATVRCVAWGSPGPRTVVTGAPVRHEISTLDRSLAERQRAKARLSPPIDLARRVVVVMSGSLGASRVNDAAVELAKAWSDRADLALIHITGRRDYDAVRARRGDVGDLDYRIIDFADMALWWAVADLAICRAGAITIAELTESSLPAILVPLPGAPGDHQGHNARALASAGAARVVADSACTGESLARAAEELLVPDEWERTARASSLMAHPGAAGAIASVVVSVGRAS
ncbi:MAG: UDP-N-acetylglucosamine--N-acetylmuramyl-(pentapeptide) pyrophosphoryl-undecaprenol N-acetylglucosamine transferase [Acidobacteria bacterium]|nr:UDP-N-acetylglucosamine--N-acetylmuramyl-(pentapeptide) pyrophosphoryl-undecaprenol N-acetylglucosamine transferase [Acidobacteriota bacterium]